MKHSTPEIYSTSLPIKQTLFPYRRQKKFKTALGNNLTRYNSQVQAERKKYIINSTVNSQGTPQWMSRNNKYSLKSNSFHYRNSSVYANPQSPFMQTQQKWIYQSSPKKQNLLGQFQTIKSKQPRTKWEMKGHTFEFSWDTNGNTSQKSSVKPNNSTIELNQPKKQQLNQSKRQISPFFKVELPKYGLNKSPLFRQKQTPIKIGHPALIDSIYVK